MVDVLPVIQELEAARDALILCASNIAAIRTEEVSKIEGGLEKVQHQIENATVMTVLMLKLWQSARK